MVTLNKQLWWALFKGSRKSLMRRCAMVDISRCGQMSTSSTKTTQEQKHSTLWYFCMHECGTMHIECLKYLAPNCSNKKMLAVGNAIICTLLPTLDLAMWSVCLCVRPCRNNHTNSKCMLWHLQCIFPLTCLCMLTSTSSVMISCHSWQVQVQVRYNYILSLAPLNCFFAF